MPLSFPSTSPAWPLPLDQMPPIHCLPAEAAQLARLRALVEAQLAEPGLSSAQLAADVHLSERTLYRRLRELTGYTPAAFVRELRLLQARQLLRAGEPTTVGAVAHAVGFINAGHFGRVYASRFGYPPGQERGG